MRAVLFCMFAGVVLGTASPAAALVRFGDNVLIGGHDFSNRTYGPKRRAIIHLYEHTPRHEGCRWRDDRHGARTQVCHLRRL